MDFNINVIIEWKEDIFHLSKTVYSTNSILLKESKKSNLIKSNQIKSNNPNLPHIPEALGDQMVALKGDSTLSYSSTG